MTLRGNLRILHFYDVAEAIDLDSLRNLLGPRGGSAEHAFPRRTPGHVRFERAPIIESGDSVMLETGERFECSIKYYEFGAASVQFDAPFECDWKEILERTSRWMDAADIEPKARTLLQEHLNRVAAAVVRPNKNWLHEDYLVIHVEDAAVLNGERLSAAELLSTHGEDIVQLIRGEVTPLAPRSSEEALQSSLSYYPTDLIVIGASGALVYDRAEDAAATTQVLEYAKMQLLEFRYYDTLLSQTLSDVYAALERRRNVLFSRWTVPRDADRLNRIRLDVMDLTERVDNAIKFVSDIYYARVYRLAATRIGLPDYRHLVDDKLRTIGELYDFLMDQFNEARSFVVEAAIAILALLDVIFLLRWSK